MIFRHDQRIYNLDIDFTGGTLIEIQMKEYIDATEIEEITDGIDKNATINHIGETKDIIQIRTTENLNNEARMELFGYSENVNFIEAKL